ncbi:MAG: hypothetical protein QOC65_530 [Sphingomonadales bacterium]|nr:hypothetical protein [Sphingomonadales bacterium]
MRLHTALLLSVAGIILGFRPEAEAVLQGSNQPGTIVSGSSSEANLAPSAALCPENLGRDEAEPLGSGPARLATIRCLDLSRGQDYVLPPVVSPDGQSVAFWGSGQVGPLDIVPLDGGSGFRLSNRVTFRDFGWGVDSRQDALAWRSDGSALWSVEQQVVRPNGWALSGLTPILIDRGGNVQRFAPPEHAAGPLDALAWVGGDGRAIVQFGTRGNLYRPEHDDPSPTLAMIDVPRRRILHSLTATDAQALRVRVGSYNGFGIFDVSAVQLRNGRLRALLQFQRVADRSPRPAPISGPAEDRFLPAVWLLWTEGQRPAPLTPLFDDRFARAELTPDGSHILVWRALQPDGMIIDDCRTCPPPPPPTPIEGAVAALIDTTSGRTIWSVQARASESWNRFGGPVISPTGRFALIPLPAADRRQMIALLSMADGRILQRFSPACNGCYPPSFGFTRGGGRMWIGIPSRLAFYDLS